MIGAGEEGDRFDIAAARRLPELSRTEVGRWIAAGIVRLDGRERPPGRRVRAGQHLAVDLPEGGPAPLGRPPGESDPIEAEPVPLEVLHEEPEFVVLNKAAGLVVHPGPGHPGGTVANGLLHRYPEMARVGPPGRPGLVHRLDRGTSGVLLAARTEAVRLRLAAGFARREVKKRYLALVLGTLRARQRILAPIGRDPQYRRRFRCRGRNARAAESEVEPIEHLPLATLAAVRLVTGRTHQARVHLAGIGFPIAGDALYGPGAPRRGGGIAGAALRRLLRHDRPALHAASIRLAHPRTGTPVAFEAPLPNDLRQALAALRRSGARSP